jgi:hypothetical protein
MTSTDGSKEYEEAAFGDARLSRRVAALAERVAEQPDASFPTLLSEPELTAAYCFFRDEKVTPHALLQPHVAATRARIGEQVCLAVHDTTRFSYRPGGLRTGLEKHPVGNQALFAHVTLAVDCERRPLGLLGLRTHVGKPKIGAARPSNRKPFEPSSSVNAARLSLPLAAAPITPVIEGRAPVTASERP